MASALYDLGRNAYLNGSLNWGTDSVKVALVGSGYVANMATDQFFSAVGANAIGASLALANKTSAAGVADADDVTSGNLSSGSTITQLVLYKDTGTASTSPLIARFDVAATPTNGGAVTVQWDNGVNKIFKL